MARAHHRVEQQLPHRQHGACNQDSGLHPRCCFLWVPQQVQQLVTRCYVAWQSFVYFSR